MHYEVQTLTDKNKIGRLATYSEYLTAASDKRKENISITDLCSKLNTQRNTIFRIEHAEVDPKLSTLMNYLDGFDYHIEFVPNNEKTIKEKSKKAKKKTYKPDFVMDVNGTSVIVEDFDFNQAKTDKKKRLDLMMYLLELMKQDLE